MCIRPVSSFGSTVSAAPPQEELSKRSLKTELSSLNISLEASARDLGDSLNRLTPRELYKGATTTSGISAVILRNGTIGVTAADNFIYVTIPVTYSFSFSIFETPAAAATLKFRLSARVTPDWKVNADVSFTGLSERIVDTVQIGTLTIKPRAIVEGIMQPVQRNLSEQFTRKLNEKFPLKSQVASAWAAVQKPIQLDKGYSAWLTIVPRDVLLYPFYARNNQVRLDVGLRAFAELVVGPEPAARPMVQLPGLTLKNDPDRLFRIALNTDLYFKDLLSIAAPLLLNRELGSDGKNVVLKELDIYGNGDRLMIRLVTVGDLEGTVYLTCRPVIDPATNLFSVEDVDFDLQSRDLLLQTADWFLHGTIRERVREKLTMDLTQRLAQARETADKALVRVNLSDRIYLTGTLRTLKLNDVSVQKDKLSVQIYADGESTIVYR